MSPAARARSSATCRSFWHLVGVGALCAGTTGGCGLLAYYRYLSVAEKRRATQVLNDQPPVRRSRPYIAGDAHGGRGHSEGGPSNHSQGAEKELLLGDMPLTTLPTFVFYGFVVLRVVLLLTRMVPVMWYAFLTYSVRLCGEQVLFEKLRDALTAMGPGYIKFGQWIATRPDFFSPSLCAALEKLYDDTAPHGWSHTEKMLRRTLRETTAGRSDAIRADVTTTATAPASLLSPSAAETSAVEGLQQEPRKKRNNALYYLRELETVPVNSGSIAQIHRGVLREEVDGVLAGTKVAIKVMHPYVREYIAADIAAMRCFVNILTFLAPSTTYFDLKNSVHEFSCLIRSQLDLRQECDNLQQFIFNFRNVPGVIFPRPLPSLCTPDVLIETFEEGRPLQEIRSGENYRDIAERGCHMFLKMLFEDNFVHSDLHPGNLLLRTNPGAPVHAPLTSISPSAPDGAFHADGKVKLRHELVVLDAGLVTTLSKVERNNFIALFAAVACGDGKLGADLMLDRMPESRGGRKEEVDRDKFRADMQEIFNVVSPSSSAGFTLSTTRIGPVLAKIMNTLREHKTPIDGNFASLVLTVIVGEGLGRKLTPDYNIFAEAAPYLVALLEDSELYYLTSKLRDTYGTMALLRDSVHFVKPERTLTYTEMAAKKTMKTVERVWRLLTCGAVESETCDAEMGKKGGGGTAFVPTHSP